ncbi:MAG: hypothetical protein Fur0032_05670 [Terrimicrobiaceae bacterium]
MKPGGCFLIVRADDAASAKSANLAIRETVERGIVRNISVMGCGPELAHAADHLADLPKVCFGLHATLNAEWQSPKWRPVLACGLVPSLLAVDGAFYGHPRDLEIRNFSLEEMRSEILAQLARVREAGFKVSYLDTHMGFDWLPGVRDLLARIANEEGLILDTPESHPRVPCSADSESLAGRISRIESSGLRVLITHPGLLGGDMDGFSTPTDRPGEVASRRDSERRELCGAEVLRALEAKGIELALYA